MEIQLGQPRKEQISKSDLDVNLSGVFIINSNFGTLVSLRSQLELIFGEKLIYKTFTRNELYVVHWNDLNEQKQIDLMQKKTRPINPRFPLSFLWDEGETH